MRIVGIHPGHDGTIAVLDGTKLTVALEAEKDSMPRYAELNAFTLLDALEEMDAPPDVIALGGWFTGPGRIPAGGGYFGIDGVTVRSTRLLGQEVDLVATSHERAHIMTAVGMAPSTAGPQVVLVWEGQLGAFYLLDEDWNVTKRLPVMDQPGDRYAFLFALADPTFAEPKYPRLGDSGKLMALSAYGNCDAALDSGVAATVEHILTRSRVSSAAKWELTDSPLFDAGVESEMCKNAAAVLGNRIFDAFAKAAVEHLPAGLPLRIAGGCGLNCDWNRRWMDLGHFTDVFVPPCPNDAGAAIGAAIDARRHLTGDGRIEWSVYAGKPFDVDVDTAMLGWRREPLDLAAVVRRILSGQVTAWVQGAWEIGPRALGNRSLLASAFAASSHGVLNEIKQREGYRPIAPCCRVDDLGQLFDTVFEDPHMLYFRNVVSGRIPAVTHVDGTARVQTVSSETNAPLYALLNEVAAQAGVGILCNTSLNRKGAGFINHLSDLLRFCEARGILQAVVGDQTFVAHTTRRGC